MIEHFINFHSHKSLIPRTGSINPTLYTSHLWELSQMLISHILIQPSSIPESHGAIDNYMLEKEECSQSIQLQSCSLKRNTASHTWVGLRL